MLFELYLDGYLNYKDYIIKNASTLELTPNEVAVLFYLLDEYRKGVNTISISKIEESCLLHMNEITQALSNMLEHSFYKVYMQYENGIGVEKFTVEPFFLKIEQSYTDKTKPEEDEINKIIRYVEKKTNRIITSSEYDILIPLITEEHHTYLDIQETINHIEKSKYDVTVRNIAKFIEKNENPVVLDESLQKFMKKIGLKK